LPSRAVKEEWGEGDAAGQPTPGGGRVAHEEEKEGRDFKRRVGTVTIRAWRGASVSLQSSAEVTALIGLQREFVATSCFHCPVQANNFKLALYSLCPHSPRTLLNSQTPENKT